jgi:hypothetical protein
MPGHAVLQEQCCLLRCACVTRPHQQNMSTGSADSDKQPSRAAGETSERSGRTSPANHRVETAYNYLWNSSKV